MTTATMCSTYCFFYNKNILKVYMKSSCVQFVNRLNNMTLNPAFQYQGHIWLCVWIVFIYKENTGKDLVTI